MESTTHRCSLVRMSRSRWPEEPRSREPVATSCSPASGSRHCRSRARSHNKHWPSCIRTSAGRLCYNLTAVPAAALGFVPPWLAALGMSLSSLVVILNALRIGRDVSENPAASTTARSALVVQRTLRHEHRARHAGFVRHPAAGLPQLSSSGPSITISSTTWTRRGCCRSMMIRRELRDDESRQ